MGTYGQIILLENESWERKVIAASLAEFLTAQIEQIQSGDAARFNFILGIEDPQESSEVKNLPPHSALKNLLVTVPFSTVKHLIPADSWLYKEAEAQSDGEPMVHYCDGDLLIAHIDLAQPFIEYEVRFEDYELYLREQTAMFILVSGNLKANNIFSSSDDGAFGLIVLGSVEVQNMVVGGGHIHILENLRASDLIWGNYNHGGLYVSGEIFARIVLITDGFDFDEEKTPINAQECWIEESENYEDDNEFYVEAAEQVFEKPHLRYFIETIEDEDYEDINGWNDIVDRNSIIESLKHCKNVLKTTFGVSNTAENSDNDELQNVPSLFVNKDLSKENYLVFFQNYQEKYYHEVKAVLPIAKAEVFVSITHNRKSDGKKVDQNLLFLLNDGGEILIYISAENALKKLFGKSDVFNVLYKNTDENIFQYQPLFNLPEAQLKFTPIWEEFLALAERSHYYFAQLKQTATKERISAIINLKVVKDKYNDYEDGDKMPWLGGYNLAFDSSEEDYVTFRVTQEIKNAASFDASHFYYDAYSDYDSRFRYWSSQNKSTNDFYTEQSADIRFLDDDLLKKAIKSFVDGERLILKDNEKHIKSETKLKIVFPNPLTDKYQKPTRNQIESLQKEFGFSADYALFLESFNGFYADDFSELKAYEDYLDANTSTSEGVHQELKVLYNFANDDAHYDVAKSQKDNIFKDIFFIIGEDPAGNEFVEVLAGNSKGYIGSIDHEMYLGSSSLQEFLEEFEIEGETNEALANALCDGDFLIYKHAKSMKDFIENGIYFDFENDIVMVKDLEVNENEDVAKIENQFLIPTAEEIESRKTNYNVSKPFEKITISNIVFTLKNRLEAAEILAEYTSKDGNSLPYDTFEMFSTDNGKYIADEKAFFLVAEEEVNASALYLDTLQKYNDTEIYVLGYIFKEKLTLSHYLQTYELDFSPPIICLNDATISSVMLSGTHHYFHQDLTATTIWGKYNHGSLYVNENASANLIFADDFRMDFNWITAADAIVCEAGDIVRNYNAMDENGKELFFKKPLPATHRLQDCFYDDLIFENDGNFGFSIKEDGYYNDVRKADDESFIHLLKKGFSVLDYKKMNSRTENFQNNIVSWMPKIMQHPKLRSLQTEGIQYEYPNPEIQTEYYFFYKGEDYYQIGFWISHLNYVVYATVSPQNPAENLGSVAYYESDNSTEIFRLTQDFSENSMAISAVQLRYFEALENLGIGFASCSSYPASALYFDFHCFDTAHSEEYAQGFFCNKIDKTGLKTWSDDTEFLYAFQEFAQANQSGSSYAFWLLEENIDHCPIVVFGDEGGCYVVAENLKDFLHFLSYDVQISVYEGVSFYKDEDDYEESEQRQLYIDWLKSNLNLEPINEETEVEKLIQKASHKYQKQLDDFLAKFGVEN